MAITIPILTDFDGRGIDRGIAQFKRLEGTGAKAGFAIKKAAVPAGIALAALGAAAFDATKAAIEDQAAQEQLARTLATSTKATNTQVKAVEDFITQTSMAASVSDDELRPALAILARGTGDLTKAQQGLGLALDVAAGTGKPLAQVSEALSKAYAGNLKGLNALDPRMKELIKNGATAEEAIAVLSKTFKGDAAASADTAAGRFKGLGIALDETKESVGAALLPAVEKILPVLQKFAKWAQENPNVFLAIAAAIGVVAAGIIGLNVAMMILSANPVALIIGAIVVAVAGLTIGLIALYKKSETFRDIVAGAWEAVQKAVKVVVDYLKGPAEAAFTIIKGVIDTISALIKGDFSGAWDGLKTVVSGVLDGIQNSLVAFPLKIATAALDIGKAIVSGIADGVVGLATKVWDVIKGMPTALLTLANAWVEGLGTIGGAVIQWIKNGVTGLAGAIWDKISGFASSLKTLVSENVGDTLSGIGDYIIDKIVSGAKAVASGLVTALKSIINGAIKVVNAAIRGLNGASSVINAIIPGGDPVGRIPEIPKLARGGIVTQPTLALIGEAGPEAVVPLNGAREFGNITINIEAGLVSTPDQVGQQIIEAIQRAQRRSGPVFAAA
jgi:phage-related protein